MSAVEDTDRELVGISDDVMTCRASVRKAFADAKKALARLEKSHGTSKSESATNAKSWLIGVHDAMLIAEDDLEGVVEQLEALRREL